MERAVGHRIQKGVPLLLVVVGIAWGVANDTDAQEWYLVEVTGVGDGRGLHLARQPFREAGFDLLQRCLVGDELVASADKALFDPVA